MNHSNEDLKTKSKEKLSKKLKNYLQPI